MPSHMSLVSLILIGISTVWIARGQKIGLNIYKTSSCGDWSTEIQDINVLSTATANTPCLTRSVTKDGIQSMAPMWESWTFQCRGSNLDIHVRNCSAANCGTNCETNAWGKWIFTNAEYTKYRTGACFTATWSPTVGNAVTLYGNLTYAVPSWPVVTCTGTADTTTTTGNITALVSGAIPAAPLTLMALPLLIGAFLSQ